MIRNLMVSALVSTTAGVAVASTVVHLHTSGPEGFSTNSVWIDDGHEVTVITGPDFFTVLDAPIPDAELDASSTTTTTILADPTSTTSADDQAGESGTTDGGDETTTTTEPEDAGYLPGTPPPGETC